MVQISPIVPADISELMDLEISSFTSDRFSRRQFSYLITKANSIAVKTLKNDILSGYMILLKRKNSRKLRIYSICVAPAARQRGLGRKLLEYAEKSAYRLQCNCLTLEVCRHNHTARNLYGAAGFNMVGRKSAYYESGCTALLLHKQLPEIHNDPSSY